MRKTDILNRIALDIKRGGYHTTESARKKAEDVGFKLVLPSVSIRNRIPNLEFIRVASTAYRNKDLKIKKTNNIVIFVKQALSVHHPFWHYFEKEHLNEKEEHDFIRLLEKKGWEERDSWPPRQAQFYRFRSKDKVFTCWTEPAASLWNLDSGETMYQEEFPDGDKDWEEVVASVLEVIQERARDTAAEFDRSLEAEREQESFGFTRSTLACQDAVLYLPRLGG